jgi:hypothetical protein
MAQSRTQKVIAPLPILGLSGQTVLVLRIPYAIARHPTRTIAIEYRPLTLWSLT